MVIKILGSGCANCNNLEQITREAVEELGICVTFEHVTSMQEIMKYQILRTPALVVDGQVKLSGRIPSKSEILDLLKGSTTT